MKQKPQNITKFNDALEIDESWKEFQSIAVSSKVSGAKTSVSKN